MVQVNKGTVMRLTTKGRFAVTAMLDLALQENSNPISLNDISERQRISLSYLEQLFSKLRRAGLVGSVRGSHGGYVLARTAKDISIAAIIEAVDESLDNTKCYGRKDCHGPNQCCITHDLWISVNHVISHHFTHIHLADLVENHRQNTQNNTENTNTFGYLQAQQQG